MPEETLTALLTELSRLDGLRQRFGVAVLTPPAEGSAAQADQGNRLRAYAYDQAAIAISASLDHLYAWWNLLRGGEMPTYAHLTLLRTAHESALLAYWLTEPGIGLDLRMARGVAAQAADYDERRRFEDSIGRTTVTPPARLAEDRLADLMASAADLDLVRPDRRGNNVLAVSVPATVELFDLYEPPVKPGARPQFLYRLYSGYAHAKQCALTQGAVQQAPFDSSGRTIALVQGNDGTAVVATERAMNAAERATKAYEALLP
jgi:hypothetical protein